MSFDLIITEKCIIPVLVIIVHPSSWLQPQLILLELILLHENAILRILSDLDDNVAGCSH